MSPSHFCVKGKRQAPNATEDCPRQFGLFKLGDENDCGDYINCANGVGVIEYCPEGLGFNPHNYQCDYPDKIAECSSEGFLGFTCPPRNKKRKYLPDGSIDVLATVRHYRHPETCTKYLICDSGHPRLQKCPTFHAFNEETKQCDFYNHVKGCEKEYNDIYYKSSDWIL